MANSFTFNGTNCSAYGIFIETEPIEEAGQKITRSWSVPGRTGELTRSTGAYSNTTRTYKCMFRGTPEDMRAVRQWLALSEGYCELTDTYDAGIKRLARVIDLPQMENFQRGADGYGRFEISFNCDPRKFIPTTWTRGETNVIANPYMPARPVIQIEVDDPDAVSYVKVGSSEIIIVPPGGEVPEATEFEIDSEKRTVKMKIDGEWVTAELMRYIIRGGYPILKNGNTTFTESGAEITAIQLNYWQP